MSFWLLNTSAAAVAAAATIEYLTKAQNTTGHINKPKKELAKGG